MNQIQAISVCIRCGKKRIMSKTWVEKLEKGGNITRSKEICPDKECQAIVDADFAAKLEKKLQMLNAKK